jgi:hypothetical protein
VPSYALDDAPAVQLVDRSVEVVSEARWKLFNP